MIKFLFLDLDDTILDFHKAEGIAIRKTLRHFGLEPEESVLTRYRAINIAHWQMLERKEMTRDQVVVGRFRQLFEEYGIPVDPEAVALRYENDLSVGHYFLPGALEAVQELSQHYKLYLASNGTAKVQAGRLSSADIGKYFEKIFVSQEIGTNKPDRLYFDRCAAQIPDYAPEYAMMVGDSLTSDIQGGINAGMKTVWVNPDHKSCPPHLRPDYEIEALRELPDLLRTLQEGENL